MINFNLSENDGLNEFKKICSFDELKENEGRRFFINNVEVAVFKVEGEVYALSNVCPHQQTAMIFDGFIENGCVVCPAHGWMFNLKTGKLPTQGKGLDAFPVKIIDGFVYAEVKAKKFRW